MTELLTVTIAIANIRRPKADPRFPVVLLSFEITSSKVGANAERCSTEGR
jgi:hypothetical protein